MDRITSRKNSTIAHVRALAGDGACRREKGQYLCDGIKTLKEALAFGAEVCLVLWKEQAREVEGLSCREQYILPAELFDYASTMKNSPGPLFAVAIPQRQKDEPLENAVILENVQDGIYITDSEANTVYLNHSYELIIGLQKAEILGKMKVTGGRS